MRALVIHGKEQPAVRAQALSLVSDLLQKDYESEAQRVHAFVRDEIRYTRDVRGVETLHTAPQILAQRAGDCDDKTVIAAALLEALGARTRLVAIGYGRNYQHVYPMVWLPQKKVWRALETTENWPFGKEPPAPTVKMVVDV